MKIISSLLILTLVSMVSCSTSGEDKGPYLSINGPTQGTWYHITYECPTGDSVNFKPAIDSLLHAFDMSVSTYVDSSIISAINRDETGVIVDDFFREVFLESYRIYELTDGAFDITAGPLVDAWGFGPGGESGKLDMTQERVDSLLQYVGMDKLKLTDGKIVKERPGIRLDVNAIAQGYSVDVVGDFLEEKGVENYMVEIGGELKVKGLSKKNINWRIGIDKPSYGNQVPGRDLMEVIEITDLALATSGNYRKFYELDGKKIVHSIDPRSGYTRPGNLLSATIVTPECMTADALATACIVLGFDDAVKLVDDLVGVEGYFIYTDDLGIFMTWSSEGMKEMLGKL